MKLVETVYTQYDYDLGESDVDYRVAVELIDDKGKAVKSVAFREGEPEDMKLYRYLADAYDISDLVMAAYELGRKGKELEYEHKTVSDE